MSRFLIACGGTGGHLSPGIALAEGLNAARARDHAPHQPQEGRRAPDREIPAAPFRTDSRRAVHAPSRRASAVSSGGSRRRFGSVRASSGPGGPMSSSGSAASPRRASSWSRRCSAGPSRCTRRTACPAAPSGSSADSPGACTCRRACRLRGRAHGRGAPCRTAGPPRDRPSAA